MFRRRNRSSGIFPSFGYGLYGVSSVSYTHLQAEWICDTVGNKSTLHPSTSSIVFEIEGNLNTKLHFIINGKEYDASIEELLEYG